MEIDAYFQGFRDGDETAGGGAEVREVLAPHVVDEEPEHGYLKLRVGEGGADVYLDESHMLVNHVAGEDAWDLLVDGARAAGWVALAPGRPPCITDEAQRAHLPEDYAEDVVLVTSGSELAHTLRQG
jgi:hypothetical protein